MKNGSIFKGQKWKFLKKTATTLQGNKIIYQVCLDKAKIPSEKHSGGAWPEPNLRHLTLLPVWSTAGEKPDLQEWKHSVTHPTQSLLLLIYLHLAQTLNPKYF